MAKMLGQYCSSHVVLTVLIATFLTSQMLVTVSARYLPTRSQEDRLEKLRELLKDLLESGDLDRRAPQPLLPGMDYGEVMVGRPLYKRAAQPLNRGRRVDGEEVM